MRRLTQAQMDSDQGRIYGRAPIPGAKFERDGVFYDSRGYECMLPGKKAKEPEPEPEIEVEWTEDQVRIEQFKGYLDSIVEDEHKSDLIEWAKDNLGKSYHPRTGLAKLKEKALADFVSAIEAEKQDEAA